MREFIQKIGKNSIKLVEDTKTIEWLIDNTYVELFNVDTFEGYQRHPIDTHINKIVKYLENSTLLPTAIICAVDEDYNKEQKLRVVDGQHRIRAFEVIKETNDKRYSEIKNIEMPIMVMIKPELEVEIDTFVNINKTSKKVDTSLALVLKSKNRYVDSGKPLHKREYMAVEIAKFLNEKEGSIWQNNILFEGNVKNRYEHISLNSFVIATRGLLSQLDRTGAINVNWNGEQEAEGEIYKSVEIIDSLWNSVYKKWYTIFDKGIVYRDIIQGAIGYTAITKYILYRMKDISKISYDELHDFKLRDWIYEINIDEEYWLPGNYFSKFTSASGHTIVAKELLYSTGFIPE